MNTIVLKLHVPHIKFWKKLGPYTGKLFFIQKVFLSTYTNTI